MDKIKAEDVKASDVLAFGNTPYMVRSSIVRADRVELTFWHVNSHGEYYYERDELLNVWKG